MVNAWSLLYEELNGTMDEVYPIMTSEEWVRKNGGYEYTPEPSPKDDYEHSEHYYDFDRNGEKNYVYESPDGGKTVTRRKPGSLDKEVIKKPTPNLKGSSNQKYKEDAGIADLKDYISSTYSGHYTSDQNNTQTLDLIQSVGDAESFCRSNAIKYLARYDRKGQAKRDILKAMHYCLLLYYFSGQTVNDETPTRGYETF